MNYLVVMPGHIAAFEQYESACSLAADFGGQVFNMSGLLEARRLLRAFRTGRGRDIAALWGRLESAQS